MFWTILLFVITAGFVITIHELGHYCVMRVFGLIPERFCIGFGPKIFVYRSVVGTEFVVAAIPLGGYVKLNSGSRSLNHQMQTADFDSIAMVKRAVIVAAGPLANFILAFFIYWAIFQIGVVSLPVTVEKTVPGSVASLLDLPPNATLTSIDGVKIENWQDVHLALVNSIDKRSINIRYCCNDNGKMVLTVANTVNWRPNVDQGDPITAFGFIPKSPKMIPVIATVLPDSPAEQAGLLAGDRIIGFNGHILSDWSLFTAQVKKGDRLNLEIIRNNQHLFLMLIPVMRKDLNKQQAGFIGVVPTVDLPLIKYHFLSAAVKSLQSTYFLMKLTVKSFYKVISGSLDVTHLSGPIALARNAYDSASHGIVPYLYFLAFISINLGVVNLVPLPILDGGHLLLLLFEKIKGSPLSKRKLTWIYNISILLLMLLMVIVFFNDLSRM